MPSSWANRPTSHRVRVIWSWTYVTLMACGFATIAAAVYLANEFWIGLGATAFCLGGLLLAFNQFFAQATLAVPPAPRPATAAAAPVASAKGRSIDFSYDAAPAAPSAAAPQNIYPPLQRAPASHASAGREEEPLIEFELVTEPQAPTRLDVPPAFQLEDTVDALAEGPVALTPAVQREDFVPAVARRREIVSGLPILSRVFADEAPAATQVTPRADGKTRGQCGNCGTFLWAPSERPIRLRCPRCGNVKTLTA